MEKCAEAISSWMIFLTQHLLNIHPPSKLIQKSRTGEPRWKTMVLTDTAECRVVEILVTCHGLRGATVGFFVDYRVVVDRAAKIWGIIWRFFFLNRRKFGSTCLRAFYSCELILLGVVDVFPVHHPTFGERRSDLRGWNDWNVGEAWRFNSTHSFFSPSPFWLKQ